MHSLIIIHKELSDGSKLRFKKVWAFHSPHDPNATFGDFITKYTETKEGEDNP